MQDTINLTHDTQTKATHQQGDNNKSGNYLDLNLTLGLNTTKNHKRRKDQNENPNQVNLDLTLGGSSSTQGHNSGNFQHHQSQRGVSQFGRDLTLGHSPQRKYIKEHNFFEDKGN
uniref:Uncharacterized protein n=1 Tax=Meloidogyne hapla TaxID=6305 RepID=A0A1I8B2M7_MELHA